MAKKSSFGLQRLLDVRHLGEKEKQKELSQSKRKLRTEQENLLKFEVKRDQVAQKMQSIERGEVSRFMNHHTYLSSVLESIERKRNEIKDTEQEVEEKRQHLLEATKDRKALEKLKEKHILEQRITAKKTEQSFMDEIALRKGLES